jgi:hypothetical protein
MPVRSSSIKLVVVTENVLSFLQFPRLRYWRELKRVSLMNLVREEQKCRFNLTSLPREKIDGWTLFKSWQ